MEKDVEEFCAYLAKAYVRLTKAGIPQPIINCWISNALVIFYASKSLQIDLQFKQIMDSLKGTDGNE